jgi:sRNA-binding protein
VVVVVVVGGGVVETSSVEHAEKQTREAKSKLARVKLFMF